MAELKRITEGGYYPYIDLQGSGDDLECDGLVIDAPDQVVVIGQATITTTRVPLIVKRCQKLIIDVYRGVHIWGDGANFRCSNIHISHFMVSEFEQRFNYEHWHMDTVFQAYAVKENGYEINPKGIIENITIPNLISNSTIKQSNGIMLSELCQYRNFNIGTNELNIFTGADYWLNANNLSDSVIGGSLVNIRGFIKPWLLSENKPFEYENCPTLFIKNRPKNGIQGCYASGNIHLINIPFLDKANIDCAVASYGNFELEQGRH